MNDDELRLYGEFQREFNSKAAKERNRKFFKSLSERETYDGDIYTGKFKEMSDERAKKSANKYNNLYGNHYSPEDAKVLNGKFNNNFLVNTEMNDPTYMKQAGDTLHNKKTIIENRQKRAQRERLKNSRESIAKHAEKADKLRKLKYKRQTATKIVLGTAAAAGLAYGGKKLYDHYKKNKEE